MAEDQADVRLSRVVRRLKSASLSICASTGLPRRGRCLNGQNPSDSGRNGRVH